MKKSSLILITILATTFQSYAKNYPLNLSIVHMNDTHSHFEPETVKFTINGKPTSVKIGGFPEVIHELNEYRKSLPKNRQPLVLHAGDALNGTLYYTLFKGVSDAKMINAAKFDYLTLGNHEFDSGDKGLKIFLDNLKVPVLSSNVIPNKKSILYGYWKPYAIKKIRGEKVGIIGLEFAEKTRESSSPGKDIKIIDEVQAVQKYINILKKKGVNKIILLSHAGVKGNTRVAKNTKGLDVIISGDSHFLFGNDEMRKFKLPVISEYPTKVMSLSNEPVYIVEGWEYTKLLGRLDIKFSKSGIVKSIKGNPVIVYHEDSSFERKDENGKKYTPKGKEREEILETLKNTKTFKLAKPDKKAKKIFDKYYKLKKQLGDQVIGELTGDVMPGGSEHRIPHKNNPKGSIATRFVAETMLTQMRSFGENSKVDFAIQNSGGVRQNINTGKWTYNDAYNLLPFGNTLYLLNMKGSQVKNVIEEALDYGLGGGSTGSFPYGAGLRYEANQYKDKKGKRIVKIEVENAKTGKFEDLQDDKDYTVVTNGYIAKGKDGYKTFGNIQGKDTFIPDAQSFIKFLQMHKNFKTYTDSNVIFHFDGNNEVKTK